MSQTEPDIRLSLYAGAPHDCAYLAGRHTLLHYIDPQAPMNPGLYGALLARGFRRSGGFVYRPACPACERCVAARIPVADFTPGRSQRRCAATNDDLRAHISDASITDEHFALYRRYVNTRHVDGGMANPTPESCRDFLLADWCDTLLLDLRLDGRLVACAVTDRTPTALSAVYTFFDPELAGRSLGTFAILSQISLARRSDLKHLYLGYWVPGSPKMEYKTRFRPLGLLREDNWFRLHPGETPPRLP